MGGCLESLLDAAAVAPSFVSRPFIVFLSRLAMGRRNRGRRRAEGGSHNAARLNHQSVARHEQSLALESEWGDSPWAAAVQAEQPGASTDKTAPVDGTAKPFNDSKSSAPPSGDPQPSSKPANASKSSRAASCVRDPTSSSAQDRPAATMPYVFPTPPYPVHKFMNLEHRLVKGDD